jgi:hypothetical protein
VPQGSARHYPPPSLQAIWIPLLEGVAANHAHFPTVLTLHIITRLLADADTDPPKDDGDGDGNDATMTASAVAEKTSYDLCLAAWGMWLVEWRRVDESDADISTRRQDVFFQLVQAPVSASSRRDDSSLPRSQQPGYVPFLSHLPHKKKEREKRTSRSTRFPIVPVTAKNKITNSRRPPE